MGGITAVQSFRAKRGGGMLFLVAPGKTTSKNKSQERGSRRRKGKASRRLFDKRICLFVQQRKQANKPTSGGRRRQNFLLESRMLNRRLAILQPSRNGYEKAKNGINEETQVGPGSEGFVAGTNIAAPQAIQLADGRLMKRRQGANAVPLFEHTGTVSRHGIKLLFEPWRHLEDVDGTQEEVETVNQRRRRLEIFPCSLIRYAEDEDDDTDDVS